MGQIYQIIRNWKHADIEGPLRIARTRVGWCIVGEGRVSLTYPSLDIAKGKLHKRVFDLIKLRFSYETVRLIDKLYKVSYCEPNVELCHNTVTVSISCQTINEYVFMERKLEQLINAYQGHSQVNLKKYIQCLLMTVTIQKRKRRRKA